MARRTQGCMVKKEETLFLIGLLGPATVQYKHVDSKNRAEEAA